MKTKLLSTSAILAIAFTGCTCGSSKPDGATSTKSIGAPGAKGEAAGPPLASKEFYRLDLAGTPDCKAGASCDVKIALTALQGHHVNGEYPMKFVPVASPNLGVEGTGSFAVESETRGVMTIKVTPTQAGTHTLDGQFKLSVCTDDKCEIDGPKIALSIAAT
jgi:hypothetical protein